MHFPRFTRAARACLLAMLSLALLPGAALAASPMSKPRKDAIAPVVSITKPAANTRVWGTTKITASASDNVAVSRVDFYVDGVLKGSDASAPYELDWNAGALPADSKPVITAKAYDTTLNPGTSAAVSVVVSRQVPLGTAVRWDYLTTGDNRYRSSVLQRFGSITPENEMKFAALEPQEGVFDFSVADQMVDFAQQNGKEIRGHTLIWDGSNPTWLWTQGWTRDQAIAILERHVKTVVGRYAGRIKTWDVVNEPLNDDGTLRQTLFEYYIGPEYIEIALRAARAADPAAKLVINDYDVERTNAKSDGLLALVKDLKARGVPINGVGFQAHVYGARQATEADLSSNLQRFGASGLDVELSEMDVRASDLLAGSTQADVYGRYARVCRQVTACKKLTVWGVSDATSWLGLAEAPLLLDGAYTPKPAYDSVADELALSAGPR
jgi:endo-1,4-beta-xylanase